MNRKYWLTFIFLSLLLIKSAPANESTQTFERLYQKAESRSPRVAEFAEYLKAAESEISEAKSGYFPQITLSGSSRVNQYGANAYNGSVPSPAYAVGVSTWNLFDGGKTTNSVSAREFSRDAASQRLELARAELVREVMENLLEKSRLIAHRAAFERLSKHAQEISKAIQSQVEVDQGRRSELFILNTKSLQISLQEADLARREFEHRVRSEKLFGEILINKVEWPILDSIVSVDAIIKMDPNVSPNLIAIRSEAESAKALVKTVTAQNYPSVNWVIQKSTQKDILDRDTPIYTAITFSVDIFRGFGISSAERSAASRAGGAQSRYDHAYREFVGQLKSWSAQLSMLVGQVRKYSEIERDAYNLLEVAYRRYELGRAVQSELLDAELSYYSARVAYANGLYERDQLHARVITETGLHRRLVGFQ